MKSEGNFEPDGELPQSDPTPLQDLVPADTVKGTNSFFNDPGGPNRPDRSTRRRTNRLELPEHLSLISSITRCIDTLIYAKGATTKDCVNRQCRTSTSISVGQHFYIANNFLLVCCNISIVWASRINTNRNENSIFPSLWNKSTISWLGEVIHFQGPTTSLFYTLW